MENYKDSVNDFNVAKTLEPSLGGRKQIEAELNLYLDKCSAVRNSLVRDDEENSCVLGKITAYRYLHDIFQPSLQSFGISISILNF